MSVETDVWGVLANHAGLTALVPAARITPVIRQPGSALPAVVYFKVSDVRVRHMGGDATFSQARIQINAYAATYSEMKAIQLQARLALQSHEGESPLLFTLTSVEEGADIYDDTAEEHFSSTDFTVWHCNA